MADMPRANGREQSGRRPAVVLQDEHVGAGSPLVVVVPLSSQLGARRFPGCTVFDPSETSGLAVRSVALGFQMRALDRDRFLRWLGVLTENELERMIQAVRTLVGL